VEREAPKPGDIVIRREPDYPPLHYSVRDFPRLAQVSYASFEMALDVATRLARLAGTSVWYEQEGRYGLIESRHAAGTV